MTDASAASESGSAEEKTAEEKAAEKKAKHLATRTRVALAVHIALIVAALLVLRVGLNPSPTTSTNTGASTSEKCAEVLPNDDLVHLALRTESDQARQIQRWKTCDPDIFSRARHALGWDYWLIAIIAAALSYAVFRCWRRIRWRLAAYIGALLTGLYVWADLRENSLLDHVLDTKQASASLHWPAAIKFGAFIAVLPLFLVSSSYAVTEFLAPRAWPLWEVDLGAIGQFLKRWWRRLFKGARGLAADPEALAKPPERDMGVCCSGGGIRSAAFSLGALQALDDGGHGAKRELADAKWLSAVSGGSYLAAAWVSARKRAQDAQDAKDKDDLEPGLPVAPVPYNELPWARRSAEEDHLRRHSSYLAPGVGGKLFALSRYLFGLMLNLGVVLLALAALFLPYGWFVARYDQPKLVGNGNQISLPAGGCLERLDGTLLAALPGTSVVLASASEVELDSDAPARPPAKPRKKDDSEQSDRDRSNRSVEPAGVTPGSPAPTSTTCPKSASSPPASTTSSASTTTGPPAAKRLRRLAKGTQVTLELNQPLPVTGSDVSACRAPVEKSASWSCSAPEAEVFHFRDSVRLISAPSALMTLRTKAIVIRSDGTSVARLARTCGTHPCQEWAAPRALSLATLVAVGISVFAGLALLIVRPRPTTASLGKGVMAWMGIAGIVLAIVTFAFPFLAVEAGNGRWFLDDRLRVEFPGAGIFTVIFALISHIGAFTGSADAKPSAVKSTVQSLGSKLRPIIVKFAAALVTPLLILLGAVLIAGYGAAHTFGSGQVELWMAAAGVLTCLMAGGDLNEWSLHPFYRDRLRTGFVQGAPPKVESDERIDNALPVKEPQLLVCAAANIADDRASSPGRPVAPWVFTRDSIGSEALGRVFSRKDEPRNTGLVDPTAFPERLRHLTSLWEAVAVSGAAFSPSMGKMTRPERALFALGNLRLGVWYPNTAYLAVSPERDPVELGWYARDWYTRHHPRPWYLVKEALGLHRATDPWIYVTDGGHYENLGLVELLRKGCREIYCFDGSGDTTETFGTLAEAMRLAREELDIEIAFDTEPLKSENGISKFGAWAGTVKYPTDDKPSGWIVVAKLEVPKDAPFDIVDLARTLPKFPSNPTSDQLYTDQKFEAYRALGHYLGLEAKQLGAEIRSRFTGTTSVTDAVEEALAILVPPREAGLKLDVSFPADDAVQVSSST